jgi:hypothetical protein
VSALDDALAELEPWSGFDLGVDLGAVAGEDSDQAARAIVAYGFAALRETWRALPAEVRAEALAALAELAELVLESVEGLEQLGEVVGEGLSNAADGLPVVEWIVRVLVAIGDMARAVDDANEQKSRFNRAIARSITVRARGDLSGRKVQDSGDLVGKGLVVRGFSDWVFGGGSTVRWRWRNCLPLDNGQSLEWFGVSLPEPVGKGGRSNGVALHCPAFQDATAVDAWGGCEPLEAGNPADRVGGYLYVNALAWPYWSPTYPSRPMQVYATSGSSGVAGTWGPGEVDPNAALMAAQINLLIDAESNFALAWSYVEKPTQFFREVWARRLFDDGEFCGRLDDEKQALLEFSGKLTPDEQRDPNHIPSSGARRFYFAADGTVKVYPGFEQETQSGELDLAAVGLGSVGGGYGCSLADYNAVVVGARAFATARAGFLRNHRLCAAVVANGLTLIKDTIYEPSLALAIEASAKQFTGESPPRKGAGRGPRKPGEAVPRSPGEPPRVGADEADGGGGALVAVALGLGAFLLAKSRR